jgi:hypothetical protein
MARRDGQTVKIKPSDRVVACDKLAARNPEVADRRNGERRHTTSWFHVSSSRYDLILVCRRSPKSLIETASNDRRACHTLRDLLNTIN